MLWGIDIKKKKRQKSMLSNFCCSFLLFSKMGTAAFSGEGSATLNHAAWSPGWWGTQVTFLNLGFLVSWEISWALNVGQEGRGCCRGSSMHSVSPFYLEMIQAHEITWQLPIYLGWSFKSLLHFLHLSASSAHDMPVRRNVPSPQKPN